MIQSFRSRLLLVTGLVVVASTLSADRLSAADLDPSAPVEEQRGYQILIEQAFVGPSMDQELFDNLYRCWEEPLLSAAEKATPAERRKMTLSRYGLTEAPGREGGIPMQYAPTASGGWATNCFLCHGGKVNGKVIPGAPNTHVALETMAQDSFKTKRLIGREVSAEDATGLFVPLGKSNGTTNAIIFGVVLAAYRDVDLNFHPENPVPKLIHNDHDAPAWWNVKYKHYLYADGFAGKGHRALMQFMMTPSNGPKVFHDSEAAYKEIYDWVENLQPPKYPFSIDQDLAKQGEALFNKTCSECHGTYGENPEWPEVIVPIETVGTDRARLDSLTPMMRAGYELSWFSNYGEKKSIHNPGGYVAQPLNGIWASAPYLHNGSVPTLWHMMHPAERPKIWQRTEDGYDAEKVGLEVTTFEELPAEADTPAEKRTFFDTRIFAKSPQGHLFPDQLTEDEKRAVMEYLKTL